MRRGQVKVKTGPVVALLTVLLVFAVVQVTPYVKRWRLDTEKKDELEKSSAVGELTRSLRVAGDPWSGYFVFRSEKFQNMLLASKIRYTYETVEDLSERFEGLKAGKYDVVVGTIDGYTLNGLKAEYPGVVSWVIDESFGGDALVGGEKVKTIDDLDALADLAKVAYADGYPSEHLLNAVVTQFKKKVKSVPVKSSTEAYELLKAGKVDAAVLWEPDTSNAAKEIKGSHVLISTREMVEFIVDVGVVSRKVMANDAALVDDLMGAYFATLKYYQADPARMTEAIAKDAKVPMDTAQKIQAGIRFVNLADNAFHWFGVGGPDATEKVSRIVRETIEIQRAQSRLPTNPLKDPFTIINRSALERAMRGGAGGPLAEKIKVQPSMAAPAPKENITYKPLTPNEWDQTEKVGTLDVAPIYFSGGSSDLAPEDQKFIDEVAQKMTHYPRLRLRVVGHTSPGGDVKASQELSEERAKVVTDYIAKAHGVPAARLQAVGKGGAEALPQRQGESSRSYSTRSQRVEFVLVSEN